MVEYFADAGKPKSVQYGNCLSYWKERWQSFTYMYNKFNNADTNLMCILLEVANLRSRILAHFPPTEGFGDFLYSVYSQFYRSSKFGLLVCG